ncbi:MAG: class I/II aminotransferase [Parcubacteria group bacterium Athens1014_10]|nr:MAG: class I/II aminotransferase [Parcubacteria group bacterium Athens1014_10]TSD06028.1 MAG: class I/II aminotransferase [Parcubacteria group bacterium Athens0714_12]
MRTENINFSYIKQIEILASKIPGVISLAQAIPSLDTPEIIKKKVIEIISQGKASRYSLSPGLPFLREVIEEKLAGKKMYYDFEKEIIITAGATEALMASLLAILDKGDEAIVFSPSYASYPEMIKVASGKPVLVNLQEENNWQIDLKELEEKISSKTKVILFCNPNNPTGTLFKKDELLKIGGLALKHNLFIISDEAYKEFIYNDEKYFSLAEVNELRKLVIRIFTFSKAYAMTGWRIGFLHSDEEVVKEIIKVHDTLITCAPVVSQYAALFGLELAQREIKEFKKIYRERKELICWQLDQLKDFFSYREPEAAYFIFAKLKNRDNSWQFCLDLLEKAKVALVPGIAFGPNGEGYARINFSASEENIIEAFKRIKTYFNYYEKNS